MKNVLDVLKERGFVKQTIYEDELYKMLGEESVIEILVEEKENNQQIIYKITLFYTVIAS